MLLDAATTAQRTLAKQDKGDGALRAIFERFDPKHRGTVNARDFDDALRKLGVLRHHRRACLARFARSRGGRADYLDFCRFATLSDDDALARTLRDVAATLRVRDASELLEPLLEADPRGAGAVDVSTFRDVLKRDWKAKASELQLQSLASRFALPADGGRVDYEHFVRHVAAALATAKHRRGRDRTARFAPGVRDPPPKAPPRGEPLDGRDPWFRRRVALFLLRRGRYSSAEYSSGETGRGGRSLETGSRRRRGPRRG